MISRSLIVKSSIWSSNALNRLRFYPPSVWYLLMTLGPIIALMPFAERVKGKVADVFIVFGRVPLFYYLIHIPLIH